MSEQRFNNHKDFFSYCGRHYLHPKIYGECFNPVSVEEMYQHFKARMIEELEIEQDVDSPDEYGAGDEYTGGGYEKLLRSQRQLNSWGINS